jgi:integrase
VAGVGQKPRPERKEAAYFENAELRRLFTELQGGLYKTVCLVALTTGMRAGEIAALRWGDVDLDEAVVRVRRSYTGGERGTPKNRERRDLDLISDVVELLGWWQGEHAVAEAETWETTVEPHGRSSALAALEAAGVATSLRPLEQEPDRLRFFVRDRDGLLRLAESSRFDLLDRLQPVAYLHARLRRARDRSPTRVGGDRLCVSDVVASSDRAA